MGQLTGRVLFIVSCSLFLLGLILCGVGYTGAWLQVRKEYANMNSRIDFVGLRRACFTNFRFESRFDWERKLFNDCVDNSKNSAIFNTLSNSVSPVWFQNIQDMHLVCIILLVFNLLFIGTFLTMYMWVRYRTGKKKKINNTLHMCRCCLGLWFIITLPVGIIQIAEVGMFYFNYERESSNFFYSGQSFDYGGGMWCTVVAGVLLLASTGTAIAVFFGLVKKMMRILSGKNTEEFDNVQSNKEAPTEMERLSNEVKSSSTAEVTRKEPEGEEIIQKYNHEPSRMSVSSEKSEPRAAVSPAPAVEMRSSAVPDTRPVPAPRISSRESSIAPSLRSGEITPHHLEPNQREPYRAASRSPVRPSYDPGYSYAPKSARSVSDTDSQHSFPSQAGPPVAHSAPLYRPPPTQQYYQRSPAASDTESLRGERNRSVSRSSNPSDLRRSAPDSAKQPQVVNPKVADVKHSRYTAY